jgi:FkbH-like protein
VRKVLVLDIDDTLWGGVVGERGETGVDLGETYPGSGFVDFQLAVAELRRRGVVLALNSSNDAEHVLDIMRRHPAMVLRPDDFSASRINWQDKATNMVEIADELGLGLDSFVFVDNSESECARMRQAIPEVLTLQLPAEPSASGDWLRGLGVFDTLGFTDEDRMRADLYRGEAQRSRHREAIGSLDDYLASLQMVLTVEKVSAQSAARAADLTQRTNQFNMTTRRRTATEITGWIDNDQYDAYVFALSDRFGAQGIIGFAALHYDGSGTAEISDFMMSCRVLKRNVEQAMLATLLARARSRGARRIVADYVPTPRNAPFGAFYETSGLRRSAESPGATVRFEHVPGDAITPPPHVEVRQISVAVS